MKTLAAVLLLTLGACSNTPNPVKPLPNDYQKGLYQLLQGEELLCSASKSSATQRYNTSNSRMAYIKLCENFYGEK